MTADPYLSAKELADAMSEMGLQTHEDYAREIIRASPDSIRFCLRMSEAIGFLRANKSFHPFSKSNRLKRSRSKSGSLGIRKL
jgi:hypothetical protein